MGKGKFKAPVRTEICPGCGGKVVLGKVDGSQPAMFDPNGEAHVCQPGTVTEFSRRPVGGTIIGLNVVGFAVKNRTLTIELSGGQALKVYASGAPLKIWLLGKDGILEDKYGSKQ